jgi:hypothetical protein
MPLPAPVSGPPPTAAQLTGILAALGQPAAAASGDPAPALNHVGGAGYAVDAWP